MEGVRAATAIGLLGLGLGVGSPAPPRQLTFEQRVDAQEAIERVYYAHQVGTRLSFQEAVPGEILEQKVRTYLRKSAALESFWHTPITAEALGRELERIARQTRFPDRLRELYSALGNDSFLIQETLVRATLADRLTRSFFTLDDRIHGEARKRAVDLREMLASGEIDPFAEAANRTVMDVARAVGAEPSRLQEDPPVGSAHQVGSPGSQILPSSQFDSLRPKREPEPGAIVDDGSAYVVPVVLKAEEDRLRVARYRVPKTRWKDWWERVEEGFLEREVPAVASVEHPLPQPGFRNAASLALDTNCVPDHRWDNQSLGEDPAPLGSVRSVWTGSVVVYWGQRILSSEQTIGWRYDPIIDTWSPVSGLGAPTARVGWGMLWTGRQVVVWGGFGLDETGRTLPLANGGRYAPETDTWVPVSTAGAPAARHSAPAVWLDPYVVFWGGKQDPRGELLDTGGRYDPLSDTWLPVSTAGAPSLRFGHTAVTMGSAMLLWGGKDDAGQLLNTGGRYDPEADSWQPISASGAPTPREAYGIVWTGKEMVVWGGSDRVSTSPLSSGGRYDPQSDSWIPTQTLNAPAGAAASLAVWTGSLMIVWPAVDPVIPGLYVVGRYDPADDAWKLAPVGNGPTPRSRHTAVWTGTEMIIWGGVSRPFTFLNDGAKYDPAVDSWFTMSGVGSPQTSAGAVAVWTGQAAIFWGAGAAEGPGRGGRYDPVQDTWQPISTDRAPPPQVATAVWTGEKVIVWGDGVPGPTGVGTQYDPVSDSWQSISSTNAPSFRRGHSAVWTGSRMIIWGGVVGSTNLNTGGMYDPATDSWSPTASSVAPSPRENHTSVWTGTHMIVWGGELRQPPFHLNTGGLYDPATDTWSATSTVDAPPIRGRHRAVWTGNLMLIWGGRSGAGVLDTGGVYDPETDSWIPLPLSDAPLGRDGHSMVWTGNEMIIWGGTIGIADLRTGGRYLPGNLVDSDGDGFKGCDGDCDDTDADVNPNAAEECNAKDDNCDGVVPPQEADADGDGFAACAGDCDDGNTLVNPAATELPGNFLDENCDGALACDPAAEWVNHGRFVRCVERECAELVASHFVTPQQCSALVSKAARLPPR